MLLRSVPGYFVQLSQSQMGSWAMVLSHAVSSAWKAPSLFVHLSSSFASSKLRPQCHLPGLTDLPGLPGLPDLPKLSDLPELPELPKENPTCPSRTL